MKVHKHNIKGAIACCQYTYLKLEKLVCRSQTLPNVPLHVGDGRISCLAPPKTCSNICSRCMIIRLFLKGKQDCPHGNNGQQDAPESHTPVLYNCKEGHLASCSHKTIACWIPFTNYNDTQLCVYDSKW